MKYIVTLCLALLVTGNAKSQTFYVNVSGGNDAFPGSLAQPWQRLDTAINRLSAGDTLFIRGGDYTYLGQIIFQRNGTPSQPIVISGYKNEYPRVQGFSIGFSSWLSIEKIDFYGPQIIPSNWNDMDTLVVDDPGITINPAEAWDTSPFRIEKVLKKYSTYAKFFNYGWNSNPTWESDNSKGLNILACNNLKIVSNKIHHHTYGIRLKNESRSISISDNEIHHCLDGIIAHYDTASHSFSFGYSTISGNTIYQSFRNGIMLNDGANHTTVADNIIMYSGQNHISTHNLNFQSDSAGYNTISNNAVAYGGYYSEFMHYPGPSGISIHSSGPGCLVIGNYVAYHYSNSRNGNNLADGNGLISDNNPHGSKFINNVCYRNRGNGMTIVKSKNNQIIHNTFIESGFNDATSLTSGVSLAIINAADSLNVISNNIFYNSSRGGILARSGNLSSQTYIDNNLYYFASGAPFAGNLPSLYYSTPYLSFEKNAITVDPVITDSLGHLAPGSPALLAGGSLYSYPTDTDGTSRNTLTPTIGAYENYVVVGIGEAIQTKKDFKIYPNPTSNILIIEAVDTNDHRQNTFNIYSSDGKLIFSKQLDSAKMNFIRVNDLHSGMYIFKCGNKSGRFIKN